MSLWRRRARTSSPWSTCRARTCGLIRQTRELTVAKAVDIAKEICEGLAEAHKQGIVHRDLKPSNIIIDRAGDARIMDFGIARSMAVKSRTGAGVMIGTPEYMSPEQVEGKEVDARSDIYSLGIILYEMLTGRVPFEGDTPFTVGVKHKSETPKNPKLLNPNIPDGLSGLILKCLEKEKAKRYPSAADVRAELERVEKGLPTTERIAPERRPFTSREITVKFQPKKLLIPALSVLALAAAVVVILSIWPGKKAAPSASGKPTIAVVNFENKTGDKELDKWSTGIRDLLITDLNQSKFIAVLSDSDIYGILKKMDLADASTYTTEDLVKIADAGGAQYTVNGSFLKAGDEIIINAPCQKPHSRDVISPIRLSCRGFGEITARVDEMTRKIKADLSLTPTQLASDLDKSIGEISTSNEEAWAYYVESRRYHFRGEFDRAIPLLQKALRLDPEFIMANRALAAAYLNTGNSPEARKYSAKALGLAQKHPERISDRDRYFLEQNYYDFARPETEWGKGLEAGRKLLALYPDDPSGNYGMGVIYSDIEDWDDALKYLGKCIELKYRFASAYTAMADAYRAKGEPAKAQEIQEKYLRKVENTAVGHQSLAWHHITQNRLDLAGRELETAETLDPSYWENRIYRGDLKFLKGDLAGAEAEYRPLLEEKIPMNRYLGYIGLNSLLLLEGRYAEIKKLFVPLAEQSQSMGVGEAEWYSRMAIAYSSLRSGRKRLSLNATKPTVSMLEEWLLIIKGKLSISKALLIWL
jgi:eukaryotic-like serine/threonine-protein kinase